MRARSQKDRLPEQLAAQILEDVSLTDELTDDEAKTLIDWALAQTETLAARARQKAGTAEDVDAQMKQIRRVMKQINRLVGRRTRLEPNEIKTKLSQLLETITALPEAPCKAEPAVDVSLEATTLSDESISDAEALTRLLDRIGPTIQETDTNGTQK